VSTIAILGPGGVGGFLAAVLARAGEDLVIVGRERDAELIARDGIVLESVLFGRLSARPAALSRLDRPADVLLVCTKATTLEAAIQRVSAPPRLIVPLLNGLEHVDRLRTRFPESWVAAGTIRMEADSPAPGRVIHSSQAVRIELAADDPAARGALAALAGRLARAGIPTEIRPSETQVLWSKLARLNALAATTSAAGAPIGAIREDPEWRATLIACVRETAAVARADGASVDPEDSLAEIDAVRPEQTSSMQRDIAAGREPELDAILGAVQRAAARHGLACPTVARLAGMIARRAGGSL
jgi:2-dehydropantoate 2-reductase